MNTNTPRFTEGRKSNILKVLSQLHAYLSRYDDLEKAEARFEQRMKDAGCSDMYAVIDEVLDVVDTAKKSEKAKLLTKIYKQFFPKAAEAEPASDEEMESAMDSHHLDGIGEEKDTSEDVSSDEATLGDVRKSDEEYLAAAQDKNEDETEEVDEEDDTDDEKIEETIARARQRAQKILEGEGFDLDDESFNSYEDEDDIGFDEGESFDDEDSDFGEVDEFDTPAQALAGTHHQIDLSGSMNDEVFEFIEDMKSIDSEISDEEIIDSIIEEFSDEELPMERGIASDILEEYYREKDPKNEEATAGDIEAAAENMEAEGFPKEEILHALTRRYKLTQHEIEMILGDDFFTSGAEEEYPLDESVEGENSLPFSLNESADEEDAGDISSFAKPNPRSTKAAHPEAMDTVKDICEKIGCKPRFINAGAKGYQVRLGIPSAARRIPSSQHDQFKKIMDKEVNKLQKDLDAVGYSHIKAIKVGSIKDILAFVVPYETKMFEGTLSPRYATAANQVAKRLTTGEDLTSITAFLKKKGFSDKDADNILQYLTFQKRIAVREGMPGPKDLGSSSDAGYTPQASATPYDTSPADLSSTDTKESEDLDPEMIKTLQDPKYADLLTTMSKMKPEDIQNLTQAFEERFGTGEW